MTSSRIHGGGVVDSHSMSPEDMSRAMQFLLHQQAQFAADFERLTGKTERIADAVVGLTGIVGRVVEHVDRLATRQEETDRQLRETDQHLRETDAKLRTVESHLDVVIRMVERHLRGEHGFGAM